MRRSERVVFALAAAGEAAEAGALAQGADAVAPAGDDLVRIGLVADVPDQFVPGRVEHIMGRDRQLDDAKPGAEMAPGHRHGRNRLLPKLLGKLRELVLRKGSDVCGQLYRVEQRRFGTITHWRRDLPAQAAKVTLALRFRPARARAF